MYLYLWFATLVWQVFPRPIRVLLDDQYVFQPFWNALNNPHGDGSLPQHWREAFDNARSRVQRALAQQDTERVLYEVFVRLYTLRNQLMQAAPPGTVRSTWNSSVNLEQFGQPGTVRSTGRRCAMAGRCWRACCR